jgi:hypothetical protein
MTTTTVIYFYLSATPITYKEGTPIEEASYSKLGSGLPTIYREFLFEHLDEGASLSLLQAKSRGSKVVSNALVLCNKVGALCFHLLFAGEGGGRKCAPFFFFQ